LGKQIYFQENIRFKINKKINKLLEKSEKEGTSKAASIKGKKI